MTKSNRQQPKQEHGLIRQERERFYYESLGRFVHSFAKAEMAVHFSFGPFSGLDNKKSMAIKGPMRLGTLIKLIKDVIETKKFRKTTRDEIGTLLEQLGHISSFRDRVLHRGADLMEDGTLTSSNSATMKSEAHREVFNFDVEDILNATTDLQRIALRVLLVASGGNGKWKSRKIMTTDGTEVFGPWLYKQLQPNTLGRRSRSAPQTRAARQKPSPE